ncbi:MAG: periplasmic heavy metal sensor [Marinosulfonomonas sp.]
MTKTSETKKNVVRGWPRVLLFGSLAMNLLIVGLLAGAVLRHGPERRERVAELRDFGLGPFGNAFTKSDRRAIGVAMKERAGDLRKNRDVFRQEFTLLLDALRATPFDAQAVQDSVVAQRLEIEARQDIGQQLVLERISAMSDEDRAKFADRLERSMNRTFRKKK